MKFDTVERIGESEMHHGTLNDRVYLKEVHQDDLGNLIDRAERLAENKKYGKIVSKVPSWALEPFLERGYRVEAEIPGLYNGSANGYFVAGYPKKDRGYRPEKEERFIESVKTIAMATSDSSPKIPLNGYMVRQLNPEDMGALAALNRKAFLKYPYPIFEEAYLLECLEQNFEYFGLFHEGHLLEAALLHLLPEGSHAEIVDFAILSDFKGQNLSYHLLGAIVNRVTDFGIRTLYSGVRATSYGLNITFKKHGFQYGGTLVNNNFVGRGLESMNIWYRTTE